MKGEVQLEPPHIERTSDSDPLLPNRLDSSSSISSLPEAASSIEIQRDDIEGGSVPSCRICLESDCEPGDELISPCNCKGTQQFVHRSCLDNWRSVNPSSDRLDLLIVVQSWISRTRNRLRDEDVIERVKIRCFTCKTSKEFTKPNRRDKALALRTGQTRRTKVQNSIV